MNGKAAPSRPAPGLAGWRAREKGAGAATCGRAGAQAARLRGPPLRLARGARPGRQRGAAPARRDVQRAGRAGRRAHGRRPRRRHGRHVPAARHAAAHRPHPGHRERPRPGPPGALASSPRALGPRPHHDPCRGRHPGLRAAGAHRRPARAVADDHHVPRDVDGGRRLRAAAPCRCDVVSLRAPQDALRDLVGRAPLHLPGRGAVVRPPALDRRPLPRTTRWRAPTGSPCGSSRPARCSATAGGCRSCAACGTG